MLATHAVGIDLGTTYSCIARLNEHGEPVTIPNQEGELSTPSVVLFDRGEPIVGTEALRNAILLPDRVVQNSKRFIGDPNHSWQIDGQKYTPVDIAAFVIRRLLSDAERQIGAIERAVITVPAQFSDRQRQAVSEAGLKAGLKQVDIINEPVAAALCYVLGTEGLWYSELAMAQQILVYDLGGGTFDLSLVKYQKDEIRVVASGGDLHLGGIDWNDALMNAVSNRFTKEFGKDPRSDLESRQYLAWEVEQTKRSLTVRPRASLSCMHGGQRKTYQIEQEQFAKLTAALVKRTETITQQMLKDHRLGWAHIDVVLTTGGASRMPMIRTMLKNLSGRTLNTSLSPDQSIAHGATYYAGMLISQNQSSNSILTAEASARLSKMSQRSVNARELGILIRDPETDKRIPYYLIAANTTLPASATQSFGTVVPNQKRVLLHVVEGGTRPDLPPVELGTCIINDLPANLPQDSRIEVTIRYDESARVHVAAKDATSGLEAATQILREANLVHEEIQPQEGAVTLPRGNRKSAPTEKPIGPKSLAPSPAAPRAKAPVKSAGNQAAPPRPTPAAATAHKTVADVDFQIPALVCDTCGGPLTPSGACAKCRAPAPPPQQNGTGGTRTPISPTAPLVSNISREKQRTAAKPVAGSPAPPSSRPAPTSTPLPRTGPRDSGST